MCLPSGENATDVTESVCLVKGPAAVSPVTAFHTRIVPSFEPETMCRPSGENATEQTELVCPVKEPAAVSPVMAFHTRIARSSEPEMMCWPSGENATDKTRDPKFEIAISDDGQCDNCPHSTCRIRGNEVK
jgi:hypothetical protein